MQSHDRKLPLSDEEHTHTHTKGTAVVVAHRQMGNAVETAGQIMQSCEGRSAKKGKLPSEPAGLMSEIRAYRHAGGDRAGHVPEQR